MVQLLLRDFSPDEWTEIVSSFRDLSLMQTWEYGTAKVKSGPWNVERAIFIEGNGTVGAVQAVVRTLPWVGGGLVWINRGPLWKKDKNTNPSLLVPMMEELRRYWVDERHMVLRIAPSSRQEELNIEAFEKAGFRVDRRLSGWASATVDLSPPVESLRGQLQQKWRNCLNKAERLELVVQSGCGEEIFRDFLSEYGTFLKERRFSTTVTPTLLSLLRELSPIGRRPWIVTARKDDKKLGAVLIARYGQTCEYLAGSINEDGRKFNASQLLLWRALCEMKDQGYRRFDLGGMDPDRTPPGIFHFKAGLGGTLHRLIGEFEAHNGALVNRIIRFHVQKVRRSIGV